MSSQAIIKACAGQPHIRLWLRFRDSFFIDLDMPAVQKVLDEQFIKLQDHLSRGGAVVWPKAGIGTGLADLKSRAPRIWAYIEHRRAMLQP